MARLFRSNPTAAGSRRLARVTPRRVLLGGLRSGPERLAERLEPRLAPTLAWLLLILDVSAALSLMLVNPSEFRSLVYFRAQTVADLQTWGVALLMLQLATTLAWIMQGRCRFVGVMHIYLLAAWWAFWAYLAARSVPGLNGIGPMVPLLSALPAALHVAVGLVWPQSPVELPQRRAGDPYRR